MPTDATLAEVGDANRDGLERLAASELAIADTVAALLREVEDG